MKGSCSTYPASQQFSISDNERISQPVIEGRTNNFPHWGKLRYRGVLKDSTSQKARTMGFTD